MAERKEVYAMDKIKLTEQQVSGLCELPLDFGYADVPLLLF